MPLCPRSLSFPPPVLVIGQSSLLFLGHCQAVPDCDATGQRRQKQGALPSSLPTPSPKAETWDQIQPPPVSPFPAAQLPIIERRPSRHSWHPGAPSPAHLGLRAKDNFSQGFDPEIHCITRRGTGRGSRGQRGHKTHSLNRGFGGGPWGSSLLAGSSSCPPPQTAVRWKAPRGTELMQVWGEPPRQRDMARDPLSGFLDPVSAQGCGESNTAQG